jgi:hypothetical protein
MDSPAWRGKRKPFGRPAVADRDRRGPLGTPRNIQGFVRVTPLGRRAVRLTLLALDTGLPGFSREHELLSWASLPFPDPEVERILRPRGWLVEPLQSVGVSW